MPASTFRSPPGHARSCRRRESAARLALAIATLFPATAQAAPTPSPSAFVSDEAAPGLSLAAIVAEAAQRYGIPESWIRAVMHVESGGNHRAVSPKGAMGLMQLMPATWARMRARYGLGSDPFDISANINAGTAYLREMVDRYRDLPTALAAYNAGPGRVDDWRWRGRPLPSETIAYVARIAQASSISNVAAMAAMPQARAINPVLSWRASGMFTAARPMPSARPEAAIDVPRASVSDAAPAAVRRPAFAVPNRPRGDLFISLAGYGAR